MKTYVIYASYCTNAGNFASVRRVVTSENHDEALAHVAARIKRFKRYFGKLNMYCVEVA
jgi:hypothetical protein